VTQRRKTLSNRVALRRFALVGACLAALAGLPGCRSYRCGSIMHPQINTLAIGAFQNATEEPRIAPLLRGKLAEQFMTDGSLKVTTLDKADAVIRGRILHYGLRQVAAAKTRDSASRDRDSDAYQTTIFRAEVRVEFEVVIPGRERSVVSAKQVLGTADFSRLPDLNVARREGLGQAANDAARRMVVAVAEAW